MISAAIQVGSTIKVFDEKMNPTFIIEGELKGFTSNSITIKTGNTTQILDEKGQVTGMFQC